MVYTGCRKARSSRWQSDVRQKSIAKKSSQVIHCAFLCLYSFVFCLVWFRRIECKVYLLNEIGLL